jgi:transposase
MVAKGRLRKKKQDLQAALLGRFWPHHTQLLTHILAHIEFLEESIAECEIQIEALCRPFAEVIALLDTIPGISQRTAQDRVAEIGIEMAWLPSAKHLGPWAKVSPGNNESAGKRKSGRTGKGNGSVIEGMLCSCVPGLVRYHRQPLPRRPGERYESERGRSRVEI